MYPDPRVAAAVTEFRIADTFTAALTRLDAPGQKAVKTTAFDLQLNPAAPGLKFHRIERSRDPNFWSVRANDDIRLIIHKTAGSMLLAYAGHHDDAYAWAERRRIEAHPRTGALQIVETRERVEDIAAPKARTAPRLFAKLTQDDLLGIGVPPDWTADVLAADEDAFFTITPHLPAEAAEALLDYAAGGKLRPPPPQAADPVAHPDAQRRFRVVENQDELARALDAPWERWIVFLHPAQRGLVARDFNGPARVMGSAGTGKTVVALHRAVRLAADPAARVLLTTFSQPLAAALAPRLRMLAGPDVAARITVQPWQQMADELFQLAEGRRAHPASEEQVTDALAKAAEAGQAGYPLRFVLSEWRHVVDAWQIGSAEAYGTVPRLGRKSRMSAGQRERLWPVFAAARAALTRRGLMTWPQIAAAVTAHYAARPAKPFTHIVVDEAQDLGVAELRMLAALAPAGPNALFFAGDTGQRIFQPPFSWAGQGVDVRGRSASLTVNYRTSHQIRRMADRLLPPSVKDVDGVGDERDRTVSVFEGPPPEIVRAADAGAETAAVAAWLRGVIVQGVPPAEIGVFVRSRAELPRAEAAIRAAGQTPVTASGHEPPDGRLPIATMHLAKGLEYRAVVVMACDEGVLPLSSRIEAVADEVELDEVYETERHLFYVACTRARDRLLIAGVAPGSEYMDDLESRS